MTRFWTRQALSGRCVQVFQGKVLGHAVSYVYLGGAALLVAQFGIEDEESGIGDFDGVRQGYGTPLELECGGFAF